MRPEAAQGEGTKQAVAAQRWFAVRLDPMLDIQVEDILGKRPSQLQKTPEFGAGEIGNEQGVSLDVEGCVIQGQQIVAPETNFAARAQLTSDHTNRPGTLACICPVFKVDVPDLSKEGGKAAALLCRYGATHHARPRNRRTTG